MAVTLTPEALAARIQGAATEPAAAESLLALAKARVELYAADAPEAVQNEAAIRYAGYMAQSDFGAIRKESIGPSDIEYVTNHAAGFRNSGAAGLLAPWRVRRAGVIG
ncbi:MAG: hypothetical protein OXC10_07630 [Rhodospirillaceae bacterium]|nr:hypothetical protein [Rhodospirillaceae bacterium]